MSDLLALVELCTAATGPDRELDAAIVKALYPDAHVGIYIVGDEEPTVFHASPLVADKRTLPAFTGSIDAAMTLAQPNWWWSASAPLSPAAYGYSREDQRTPRAGFEMTEEPYSAGARAATIPLAICAAALRARAASTPSLNAEIAGMGASS
jgi:hypothetical protein